jgi:hypothetical protein
MDGDPRARRRWKPPGPPRSTWSGPRSARRGPGSWRSARTARPGGSRRPWPEGTGWFRAWIRRAPATERRGARTASADGGGEHRGRWEPGTLWSAGGVGSRRPGRRRRRRPRAGRERGTGRRRRDPRSRGCAPAPAARARSRSWRSRWSRWRWRWPRRSTPAGPTRPGTRAWRRTVHRAARRGTRGGRRPRRPGRERTQARRQGLADRLIGRRWSGRRRERSPPRAGGPRPRPGRRRLDSDRARRIEPPRFFENRIDASGARSGITGKPVRCRRGPATVGDASPPLRTHSPRPRGGEGEGKGVTSQETYPGPFLTFAADEGKLGHPSRRSSVAAR